MIELGKKLDSLNHSRDAIHIACIPLEAAEDFRHKRFFKLKFNSNTLAVPADPVYGEVDGIVDPFLTDDWGWINKGEYFWGVLMPNTVTGMRHHWEHPKFDSVRECTDSELWLRHFAEKWNFDFDTLIEGASGKGEWRYIVARGVDLHSASELGEDYELFWYHLEKYTGKKISEEDRKDFGWSCSC